MNVDIPFDRWTPLSVAETVETFASAPFTWGLAGGYAVEQFLGSSVRAHDDIDVIVYRDEQIKLQRWLRGWQLYAADPPGTLRAWAQNEYLVHGIYDIWGHRSGSTSWQLQLMLAEVSGDEWFSRRDPRLRGSRADLLTAYNGIPCVRIEIQLMYKAKGRRPKDEIDFQACVPRLSSAAKQRLKDALILLYPNGHPWIDALV